MTYPYPSGPGYANIGKAVVTLPPSEFIDNAHINNPCTRVQFNANACPPASVLGSAKAITPLLDEPLEGPVYFRSNGGERQLPDVVADLHGIVHIVLVGFVDTATPKTNPRLRTTFQGVPDAAVSSFDLEPLRRQARPAGQQPQPLRPKAPQQAAADRPKRQADRIRTAGEDELQGQAEGQGKERPALVPARHRSARAGAPPAPVAGPTRSARRSPLGEPRGS